ncbi:transforming growth factor, beta receptor associated protein 1, partial [Parelaphostrongylus tenuis]
MADVLSNVDSFEVGLCCDISPQLNVDEQIGCIGGSSSVVFLGTNHGRVFHLKNDNDGTFVVLGKFQLPNKQDIRQIEFASALGILLVLSDKILYDIEIGSFQVVSSRSSVQCIAVNSNPVVDDPFCLQIAIATTSKQLHICERRNSKMESLQKLNTDGNVTAMSFARFTVCFASNGTYYIYNMAAKSSISLFPFDPLAIRPHICSVDM